MKKGLSICVAFSLLMLCLTAQSLARPRFEFRLHGGWNNMDGGDLNSGVQGRVDYIRTLLNYLGYDATGEFLPAEKGPFYGGDLIFWFAGKLGVGIGGGFLSASRRTAMDLASSSLHLADFDYSVKAQAAPLHFGLYYDLPVFSMLSVSLHAGLVYLLAQADFEEVVTGNWPNSTNTFNVSGRGVGVQGGIGLKLALSRSFGILAELAGRIADVSGFEGTWRSPTETEGRLYHYEYATMLGNFPMLSIDSEKPSGPSYLNIREAKVSFSGYSVLIGVFLRL